MPPIKFHTIDPKILGIHAIKQLLLKENLAKRQGNAFHTQITLLLILKCQVFVFAGYHQFHSSLTGGFLEGFAFSNEW